MESEKCENYLLRTSSQVKGVHSTYVEYHKKRTYRNNMEPEGTSQQESGGVWSFLEMEKVGVRSFPEMENIRNPEFPENEYKQILTKRDYLGSPLESQDCVRIIARF